jgi:hypothetical protein
MPRRQRLVSASLLFTTCVFGNDPALWREFGLADTQTIEQGGRSITAYRMKDLTGALAAWEWQRRPADRPCAANAFCAQDGKRALITEDNYLFAINGAAPSEAQFAAFLKTLPNLRDTSLPAILTFIPRKGLVANSTRYILGPESFQTFAPELSRVKPGFEQGAEAQMAQYDLGDKVRAHLAIFNYPTPEMARLHAPEFKALENVHVKRSGVLLAMVYGGATDAQATTLLSRIEYEARITWNDAPPPNPIKPLYRLLLNILWMSAALSALALFAGLIYAGMRLYRRRYGSLESDEAMTTLHLTGD